MAGKITALVIQKNNKERVNLFLDGEFAFGISLNAALGLKKGQTLSEIELTELKQEGQSALAYDKALHYLSFRGRSKQEIRQYLAGKDIQSEIIEDIIFRLEAQNYVDDVAFSQAWIRNRTRLNPKSERALRHELRQKGISSSDIDTALANLETPLDETELAWQVLEKRLSTWKNLDEQSLYKKISGYLARRGFNYDIIRIVFERAKTHLNL